MLFSLGEDSLNINCGGASDFKSIDLQKTMNYFLRHKVSPHIFKMKIALNH